MKISESRNEPTYTVAIGASAGGLEALEAMFRRMPGDLGVAFVVVQHLAPDFKSQMPELMSRWTSMPVAVAENEMPLVANTVYLLPPNSEMMITAGRLLLGERAEGLALPIDLFFRSLANDAAERAIGVILSGTGSDGSRGVKDIHENGGLVIVQSDDSAKFDGMPRSAIDTGAADLILAPEQIPVALARFLTDGGRAFLPSEAPPEGGYHSILELLHERYGLDFSSYKEGTISRRIERRLLMNHADNLAGYLEQLQQNQAELDSLYHDLLIGVTRFFRDEEAFDILKQQVIPELVAKAPKGGELRVWVAGCATGEEAYSIAILLVEELERRNRRSTNVKIFATDVHKSSLDIASAGVYPAESLEGIEEARMERFFAPVEGGFKVSAELRPLIVFAPHNVIRDAPFTKLDLVSCRNLLIYLQPVAQRKALSLFHFGLRTGGVLLLGPSESPGDIADEFEVINPRWKLYRKRRNVRLLAPLRNTLLPGVARPALASPREVIAKDPLLEIFTVLLDDVLPPSVLLDSRHEIVHTFGDVSRLLRLPRGRPSLQLLDFLDGDLRLAVSGALHRAARTQGAVVFNGIHQQEALEISVRSIMIRQQPEPFLLLSIKPSTQAETPPSPERIPLSEVSRDRIDALEQDLRQSRENLQATIEELEASNEELQATNEELLASNEELQSTNEELHSVNEELHTVNSEYQKKIGELVELTSDMDNLLISTEVHTLFLDEHLCIRRFTPKIGEVFNLVASDMGRRIEGFVHTIEIKSLHEHLLGVLRTKSPYEEEVRSKRGVRYLMRILPYRAGGQIKGVVLTLIDLTSIDEWRQALQQQVTLRDRFLAMLSHELRNPLAAALNSISLAKRSELQERASRAIGSIERQLTQMGRLLDDLLDVSRITLNKIELRIDTVALSSLVHEALAATNHMMDGRSHRVIVKEPEGPLWVRVDPTRILQVLENLLINAAKYTPPNGVIEVQTSLSKGDKVCIQITDNGCGMDEETQKHVFDLFVQGNNTLARSEGGLGVGLTLVRNLVELHQGRVFVESQGVNRGSRFSVYLPCAVPPINRVSHSDTAGQKATSLPRVAIVEDRPEIREPLAEIMREDGYQVFEAGDGISGLAMLQQERPDIAFLDIGLPGLDGFEIARRIRAETSPRRMFLVALTGYGRDEDRERVSAAGFDAHIVKPAMPEQLIATMRELGLLPS